MRSLWSIPSQMCEPPNLSLVPWTRGTLSSRTDATTLLAHRQAARPTDRLPKVGYDAQVVTEKKPSSPKTDSRQSRSPSYGVTATTNHNRRTSDRPCLSLPLERL